MEYRDRHITTLANKRGRKMINSLWTKYEQEGLESLTVEECSLLMHSLKDHNEWFKLEQLFCDSSLMDINNASQNTLLKNYHWIEQFPKDHDFSKVKQLPSLLVKEGWKAIHHGIGTDTEYAIGIRYFYRAFTMLTTLTEGDKLVWIFDLIKENEHIASFFQSGASDILGMEGNVLKPGVYLRSKQIVDKLSEQNVEIPAYVKVWMEKMKYMTGFENGIEESTVILPNQ